ncbi:unnamed protein product [Clonostachys chloroleuca]|uniref:Uncharacterized protein n=1 Tax=Clonostachys chloroleuca TaxID=1926264 RepID=A0AA35Q9L1_9HYPO|nr:unnamed protein product [Clonostachys chloroleuca]
MSNPRVKRPFAGAAADPSQRQITSFFNAQSPGQPVPSTRAPALPANVQSNLISVGMRVRKSVPEGYKTKGTSAFNLWTDDRTHVTPKSSPASAKVVSRELLPFCGINKVGGLDTQPAVDRDDYSDDDDTPGLDDMPGLTMSQESTESVDSSSTSRKRFLDDDEDKDPQTRSLTPVSLVNERIKSVPRSRFSKKSSSGGYYGQENIATGNDFEDADFLVFGSGEEMDTAN